MWSEDVDVAGVGGTCVYSFRNPQPSLHCIRWARWHNILLNNTCYSIPTIHKVRKGWMSVVVRWCNLNGSLLVELYPPPVAHRKNFLFIALEFIRQYVTHYVGLQIGNGRALSSYQMYILDVYDMLNARALVLLNANISLI